MLPMALYARAAGRSDDRGMDRAGGQNHAVTWLQLESLSLLLQHEGDRSVDAVEDLLEAVRMRRVAIPRTVRPRVAAIRFRPQLRHQLIERRHGPILRLHR